MSEFDSRSPTGVRLLDTGKIESLAVPDEAFAGSRGESHHGHDWIVRLSGHGIGPSAREQSH
jgi:hypothetical protein